MLIAHWPNAAIPNGPIVNQQSPDESPDLRSAIRDGHPPDQQRQRPVIFSPGRMTRNVKETVDSFPPRWNWIQAL
jgi:hypothetical protein